MISLINAPDNATHYRVDHEERKIMFAYEEEGFTYTWDVDFGWVYNNRVSIDEFEVLG